MAKNPPSLAIAAEKVCFLIIKAREFDAKDAVTDPDGASNATDDSMISVLEDHRDDPVANEIRGFVGALNEDEQIDLVALAWLGRGDGTIDDWGELRAEAARAAQQTHGRLFAWDAPSRRSPRGGFVSLRLVLRRCRDGPFVILALELGQSDFRMRRRTSLCACRNHDRTA